MSKKTSYSKFVSHRQVRLFSEAAKFAIVIKPLNKEYSSPSSQLSLSFFPPNSGPSAPLRSTPRQSQSATSGGRILTPAATQEQFHDESELLHEQVDGIPLRWQDVRRVWLRPSHSRAHSRGSHSSR